MDNFLDIQNLSVDFLNFRQTYNAVSGLNLNMKKGEVLVLAGESGSGKTITALSITRNLPNNAKIASGKIFFCGINLLEVEEPSLTEIRGRRIAYIFQEPVSFLNPVYTIGNQITEAAVLHQGKKNKYAKEEAINLLKLVNIKDPYRVMSAYPHELSGGMNQRAFIAMSLACRPELLIADEPTTSLDVTIESQILDLLMNLKRTLGFSLLFITHNLSIAKKIADKVCIMYKGKVVEEANKDEIFNSPVHFHTRELIAAYEKIGKI